MVILPAGHIRVVLKSKKNCFDDNGLHCFVRGWDCIIHVPQRLAGMDKCVDNEEVSIFVAPSSSSAESVVSGRHLLYRRSRRASRRLV